MYRRAGLGSLTDSLAQSIAKFEGFYTPNSVAARNNNPGNLRAGPGQIGTDANGYAIFPSADAGWAALDNQVNLNIGRGLTLNEFFAGKPGVYPGYAPAQDANNPTSYASTVAGWLSIDPNVPLSSLSASPPSASPSPPAASVDFSGVPPTPQESEPTQS